MPGAFATGYDGISIDEPADSREEKSGYRVARPAKPPCPAMPTRRPLGQGAEALRVFGVMPGKAAKDAG
jgi:hypothetical protein